MVVPPFINGRRCSALLRAAIVVIACIGLVGSGFVSAARPLFGLTPKANSLQQAPPSHELDSYVEDFEDGWADNWKLAPSLKVERRRTNHVLVSTGASKDPPRYLFGEYWRNYSLGLRVKPISGKARISLRFLPDFFGGVVHRSFVDLNRKGIRLFKSDPSYGNQILKKAMSPLALKRWHRIRIQVNGRATKVFVNGTLRIRLKDEPPVRSGTIALQTGKRSKALFDDLKVAAELPFTHTWTGTNGPEGPTVSTIAIQPSQPDVVYVGTEHSAIYKSVDRGATWEQLSDANGLAQTKVRTLAIASSDPQIVYAAHSEQAGTSKSTDGGAHWAPMNLFGNWGGLRALAVHPTDPDIVYAAAGWSGLGLTDAPQHSDEGNGIYRSSDGGRRWERVVGPLTIHDLVLSPSNPEILYAATESGMLRSDDGGDSWSPANGGSDELPVRRLVVHPTDPNVVYASGTPFGGDLFKTTDGGHSWQMIRDSGGVVALAPSDPNVLYLGVGSQLQRSRDGGQSWQVMSSELPVGRAIMALGVDPQNPDRVYIGGWQALLISDDGGRSATPPHTAMVGGMMSALAVDPTDSSTVYAAHGDGIVSVTEDAGETWSLLATLATERTVPDITALLVHPASSHIFYASNLEGVFRSNNAGRDWSGVGAGLTDPRVISLAVDPNDADRVYAGTGSSRPYAVYEGTGMFYSFDGGASWAKASGIPDDPVPAVVVDPTNPNTMYAAAMGAGMYKSQDAGETWSAINAGIQNPYIYSLAIDPLHPNTLYAGTLALYGDPLWGQHEENPYVAEGIYKTEDGGATWRLVFANSHNESIVVDPSDPNNVFISDHSEKIWHSSNGGRTWRLANQGLVQSGAHLYMFSMAISSDGAVMYMANCGRGMYRNLLKEPETSYPYQVPAQAGHGSH